MLSGSEDVFRNAVHGVGLMHLEMIRLTKFYGYKL
jgi:hypothetical protein